MRRCLDWVCRREDIQKQEEIREELIGSSLYRDLFHAHSAMNQNYLTGYANPAVITRTRQ